METSDKKTITIETTVNAPIEKVWSYWTKPEHIMQWSNASDEWHTPSSENDLRTNGKFKNKMAAKDGSVSFDFEGTYTAVTDHSYIEYVIADGRKVQITFLPTGNEVKITETFEAETTHPLDMQQSGWQAILDNFKKYTEGN
jgi:uncharacterized protein YndB with AHSA1/START domain